MTALLLAGAPLAAQVREVDDSAMARWCRVAAGHLARGDSAATVIGELHGCGASAPVLLARVWDTLTAAPPLVLLRLGQVTGRMADRRLIPSVLTAIADRSRSEAVRMEGIQLLLPIIEPGRVFLPGQLLHANPGEPAWPWSEDHFGAVTVAEPLDSLTRHRIGEVLRDVARDEPAGPVRFAARAVRFELAFRHPDVTPLFADTTLGLTYLCGNRFLLRNSGDIHVSVVARTTSGRSTIRFAVSGMLEDAMMAQMGEARFTARDSGDVTLLREGIPLALARNEGRACP